MYFFKSYLFRDISLRGRLSFAGTPWPHSHLEAAPYKHKLICWSLMGLGGVIKEAACLPVCLILPVQGLNLWCSSHKLISIILGHPCTHFLIFEECSTMCLFTLMVWATFRGFLHTQSYCRFSGLFLNVNTVGLLSGEKWLDKR